MTRVFLYTFISIFIFACNSEIGENSLSENKETNTKEQEATENQNIELVEKCFQDTAANLIFEVNVEKTNRLIIKDIYNEVIIDNKNTFLNIKSVHKDFGDRYFLLCDTKDTIPEIWEIELSTENLMFVDLDTSSINKSNILFRCD